MRGKTPEEAMPAISEALAMHLDVLAQDGIPLPQPAARADYVAVPIATYNFQILQRCII